MFHRFQWEAIFKPHPEEERIMKAVFARFIREESGEDLIEYGLLAAFVAAVAVAVIVSNPGLKQGIIGAFDKAVAALNQQ